MNDTVNNFYRVTPRKLRGYILECMYAGLVPFIRGSPGIGKSSIVRSISDSENLQLIDHRLSTSEPTDMSGLPHFLPNGKARFAPFEELFPLRGTPLPEEKQGWALFFDEMNAASRAVQAASYKVILDRMIGQHHLHDNVALICAGNLDTDRAITSPIGTALQSRVIHFELEVTHPEWYEDVAIPENYDTRIIAFLNQYPSKLMDFHPDHNEKTFCCPRTWEFMNRLIQGKEVKEENTALYAGTITSGIAAEFVQFTKVFHNLLTVKEILASPGTIQVPRDASTKWATISHMLEKLDLKNFEGLAEFANRFDMSFRITFFRSALVRIPELRHHSAYARVQSELARYLYT